MNNSAIITLQEANQARHRSIYRRLKITNPEAADNYLKNYYKRILESTATRGPVRIG
jgi:hypothetical protein